MANRVEKTLTLSAEEIFALATSKSTCGQMLAVGSDISAITLTLTTGVLRFPLFQYQGVGDIGDGLEIVSITPHYMVTDASSTAPTVELHHVAYSGETPAATTRTLSGTMATTASTIVSPDLTPSSTVLVTPTDKVFFEFTVGDKGVRLYGIDVVYRETVEP